MGTETAGDGGNTNRLSQPLAERSLSPDDRLTSLIERHSLPKVDDLFILLESLEGLAIRDQGLPYGKAAKQQRQSVAAAAREVRDKARRAIDAVLKLQRSLGKFSSAVTVTGDDGLESWSSSMFDRTRLNSAWIALDAELREARRRESSSPGA